MTMKRIEVPWTPACEREETALPRTGPAKTKLKGNPQTHTQTNKVQGKHKGNPHESKQTHTQTKLKGSTRETCIEAHKSM